MKKTSDAQDRASRKWQEAHGKKISVFLHNDTAAALEKAAAFYGVSKAEIVREALERELNRRRWEIKAAKAQMAGK